MGSPLPVFAPRQQIGGGAWTRSAAMRANSWMVLGTAACDANAYSVHGYSVHGERVRGRGDERRLSERACGRRRVVWQIETRGFGEDEAGYARATPTSVPIASLARARKPGMPQVLARQVRI
jgi:hypothetical protein